MPRLHLLLGPVGAGKSTFARGLCAEQRALYRRVDDAGHPLTIHLIDAPRELRRARVLRRNEERGETFAQVVPLEFFERASDMWEPPDEEERRERDIRDVAPASTAP